MLVETEEERRLFALGEKNSNAKKSLAKTALRKQTPNDEESDLIHAMWLRQLEYHGMTITASSYIPFVICWWDSKTRRRADSFNILGIIDLWDTENYLATNYIHITLSLLGCSRFMRC